MASILQVEQIKGPTSGASANKITVDSDQTLAIDGTIGGTASIPAARLSGTLPAIDGSALTGITGKIVDITTHTRSSSYASTSSTFSAPSELDVNHTMTNSSNALLVTFAGSITRGTSNGGIAGMIQFDGTNQNATYMQSYSATDNDGFGLPSIVISGYSGSKNFKVLVRSPTNNSKATIQGGSSLVIMEYEV